MIEHNISNEQLNDQLEHTNGVSTGAAGTSLPGFFTAFGGIIHNLSPNTA